MSILRGNQPTRDILSASLVFIFILITYYGLGNYLSVLSNPLPLKFAMLTSLFISLLYDMKYGLNRHTGVLAIVTSMAFAFGSLLAVEYREFYLLIIAELKTIKNASDAIGVEYIRAVDNPAVGLGACFAMGVATIRIPFGTLLRSTLEKLIILPSEGRPICAKCGQAMYKNT